ncbi:MAG: hypothetical protein AABX51_07015 [Nanoarchaeota archaeon]
MKKLLLLLVLLITVSSSYASVFESGEELNHVNSTVGNYYGAAAIVQVSAPVNGDVIIVAGNSSISNNVAGDITLAAGQVVISGQVLGDTRIVAGKADILGFVDGDTVVFAGETNIVGDVGGDALIASGTAQVRNIAGNLYANAGTVEINGIVKGNAVINADKIKFNEGSKILGDLNYTSLTRVDDKFIGGKVTYIQKQKQSLFDTIGPTLFAFGSALLLGIILLFIFSEKLTEASDRIIEKPGQTLLAGTAALIGVPILAIALLFTIIGIPIAIIIVLAYVAILYFGKILLALAIGRKISPGNIQLAFLSGLIIYYLIRLLPSLGFIAAVAGAVLGLGTIVLGFIPKKANKKRRR